MSVAATELASRDLRSRVNFLRQKQTRYVQVEPFMTPAQA